MDKIFLIELCQKIKLPKEETDSVFQILVIYEKEISNAVQRAKYRNILSESKRLLKKIDVPSKNNEILLAYAIACTEQTYLYYEKRGIPITIFFRTMKEISKLAIRFREKNHKVGLENLEWLQYHLSGVIFKLGIFQYQRIRMRFPEYVERADVRNAPIKRGKKCLAIHIEDFSLLDKEEILNSFRMANEFFRFYFPSEIYSGFVCTSWLLYPEAYKIFPSDSVIHYFQSLWKIVAIHPDSHEAIDAIFGREYANLDLYPGNTSLQKKCIQFLKHGGHLGIGLGMIVFPKEKKKITSK